MCTTELGYVAKLKPEFDKRNVKVIGLSVDPVDTHEQWAATSRRRRARAVNFPMIGDPDRKVADLYDMIHPNANDTMTVRSVFVIDPDKKVKLTLTYPASTGRNFDEILRVIDSLQLTAGHKVATPVNWKDGDDVIIVPAVSDEDAKKLFPKGWTRDEALPAGHPAAEQVARRWGPSRPSPPPRPARAGPGSGGARRVFADHRGADRHGRPLGVDDHGLGAEAAGQLVPVRVATRTPRPGRPSCGQATGTGPSTAPTAPRRRSRCRGRGAPRRPSRRGAARPAIRRAARPGSSSPSRVLTNTTSSLDLCGAPRR